MISSSIVKDIDVGTTIVLENLTNIRNRVKVYHGEASRRLHSWSFFQLRSFLEYKRRPEGVRLYSSTLERLASGAPDAVSPIGGIAGLSPSSCAVSVVFTLMRTSKPLVISVTNTLSVGVYLLPMRSRQRAYRLALSQWGRAGTS